MFIYLNDVSFGGETNFPQLLKDNGVDEQTSLKIVPKAGTGIIFFPSKLPTSMDGDGGGLGENVQHESLPVLEGEKWIIQQWAWSGRYVGPSA